MPSRVISTEPQIELRLYQIPPPAVVISTESFVVLRFNKSSPDTGAYDLPTPSKGVS